MDLIELDKKRHSLAHLLAAAVLEIYPDTKLTIGPAIENGFYYDFEFSEQISDKDLPRIEKEMKKILSKWESFEKFDVKAEIARKIFEDNEYKIELIEELESKGEQITLYYSGSKKGIPENDKLDLDPNNIALYPNFLDLCRGGHVENPSKEISVDSFKLDRVAGAYWRGDEKNKMLTRIYGLAFDSKKELEEYLETKEEALKRDHKKLGKELDLFTFSELVGPGLPLWTPKGTTLRTVLDDFVWKLRKKHGYEKVEIPHITKKDLYEKSGHWQKFQDELFKISTREDHLFAMKPMNCPHHTQIYSRKMHSYRELPQRYANTTMVYRDEQSGELSGLSRVRCITQDDAHVFCRHSQAKEEMLKVWEIITEFYGAVGFELKPRLSFHDPKQMDKYLGTENNWQQAEDSLREIVKEKGTIASEVVGEAAFYGPKIDFLAKDSLGREWQIATIQLDMNLPERFDLYCVNEEGKQERIVMIHAAIMGSIERYLSIVIEHFSGAFPFWLSPVQIKILPVGEKHLVYSKKIFEDLKKSDFRVETDESDENLGKKVRKAKVEKVPYFLVIGDKEVETGEITIEAREGEKKSMTLEKLLLFLSEQNI